MRNGGNSGKAAGPDQANGRRHRPVLVALLLTNVAFAFQQTAVIPALPTIEHALHTSATWTAWLLSGYLIISSVATPLVGKLGDQRGKRLMILAALAVFLVGSVGAALSPSIWVLIAFRGLQGIGGGGVPFEFLRGPG
ncbi:MAG: MFS transporter [Rubrobacteraceae bacterium]